MRKDLIDEVINSPKVDAQLDKLDDRLERVIKKLVEINNLGTKMNFNKGFSEAALSAQEARTAMENYRKERAELAKQEQITRNAITESRLEQQKAKTEIDRTREAEVKARASKKALKDSIVAEKGSVIDLSRTLAALRAQYDALGPASRKAFAGKELQASINKTVAELNKLKAATGRYQDNVGNYPKFVGGLTGFAGAFGATVGSAAIAKQVFDTTLSLDSLNAALKVVTGTEEEFTTSQRFLLAVSERLGLNVLDLTKSYKLFYAASTQAGLTALQTRDIFNAVSEVSANLKLSQEDVNGVFTAFGQIASKGKVQAEELRGQIGERIPGAFAIAARAIGVTQAQLNKMLEKGEVIASEFLPKFAKELENTFGVESGKKVEGLQAKLNRLLNDLTEKISSNQSGLTKFFGLIIDGARAAVNALDKLGTGFSFLYNKIANPDAADKMSEQGALDRLRKDIDGNTVDQLLSRRNAVDSVLIREEDRLARIEENFKTVQTASKNPRAMISTEVYNRTEKILADQEAQVNFLRQQRSIVIAALKGQLPGTGGIAQSAPKDLTKEQENAAAKLLERQRKASLEAKGISLKIAADALKETYENEKVDYELRLTALAEYRDIRQQIISETAKSEMTKEGMLSQEIKNIETQANADRLSVQRQFLKDQLEIIKSGADDRTKEILTKLEKETNLISEAEDKELATAIDLLQKKQLTEEQYNLLSLQIKNKYDNLRLQSEIDYAKKVLEVQQAAGLPVEEQIKKLNDLENQLRDENRKYHEEIEEKKTAKTKEELEKRAGLEEKYNNSVKELRNEALEAFSAIITGQYDRKKNEIQDQIELVDKQSEAEVSAINRSTASEEEKANRLQTLNLTTQNKKEGLERRQREIDQQKARFQRLYDIGTVISNTGIAVTGALGNKPWTPANIGLAAVVGGIGLAQLAQIVARPIPKYKTGTDDHPGGGAIMGDGYEHEVYVTPDGSIGVSADEPTYYDLPKHTKVFPNFEDFLLNNKAILMQHPPDAGGTAIDNKLIAAEIVTGVEKSMNKVAKAISDRPSERTTLTEAGIQHQVLKGKKWDIYVNKHIYGK